MIKPFFKYIVTATAVLVLGLLFMNHNSLSVFTKNQLDNEIYALVLDENKEKELVYYERVNNDNFIQHPIRIKGIKPPKDSIFQIQSRINGDVVYTGPFKNELYATISKDFYIKKNDSLSFYIFDDKNLTGYATEQEVSYLTWVEDKKTVIDFLPYRQLDSETGVNISYKVKLK